MIFRVAIGKDAELAVSYLGREMVFVPVLETFNLNNPQDQIRCGSLDAVPS